MCYFQYLETNKFIQLEPETYREYLFGGALGSGSDFEESILVLLEMLRIYYPAGNPIEHAISHSEFSSKYRIQPNATEEDQKSICLLSRLFSLLPLQVDAQTKKSQGPLQVESLDFDLALFASYSQMLKDTMRFVFSTIMYRNFRMGRVEMTPVEFRNAVEGLAFQKKNNFPVGLLMKSLLSRPDLNKSAESGFKGPLM